MRKLIPSLALFGALLLNACSPMATLPTPSPGLMAAAEQHIRDHSCNYDGAYEWGNNEARKGAAMNGSALASHCPPKARAAVMKGYRDGYQAGQKRERDHVVVLRETYPAKKCLEAYGERACGYDCKAAGGKVVCAKDPSHSCLVHYGEIHCGLRCREEFGEVVCDET